MKSILSAHLILVGAFSQTDEECEKVLFWHTGGESALHTYVDDLK